MYDHEEISLIEQMLPLLTTDDSALGNEQYHTARQIKKFLDSLPGGFLIYNAGGGEEILYANRALIRIFKCDTIDEFKELTGNSFKGIVYHEDLEEVEKSIDEQIQNSHDALDYVEYRIMCKDGTIKRVEDFGHFIRTQSMGDIYYVFITDSTEKINRRISERNALINENNEKEKKLKILIEKYDKERMLIRQEHLQRLEVIEGLSVNYDSILYVDLDNNTILPYRLSQRITKQFKKKLEIRGYSWFVEDYVDNWVHPDDKDKIKKILSPEYIRNKLSENRTYYTNFKCVQNNEIRYLQLRIVDVRNGEHISQVVIGARNIEEEITHEMKQKTLLERALKDSKLANVAKNTFLSNMSHDMRTPLNALFGYIELAKKNVEDKKAVELYLGKIQAAGKQLFDLVDKVLEISYLESKDFQLKEQLCNLKEIAEEIYGEISPSAEEKNIALSLDYRNVAHTEVYTDREMLKQILSHIAGNAVKYTGKNGNVNLSIEERHSPTSEFATYLFTMHDTGIGISKDNLEKIFEPFERESNSTQSGIFGSGLGLTIAKHIIESMGGTITAESEVGKGSTFTVTLSFKVSESNESSAEPENITDYIKGKKILLVEDNEINREIETEMLQDYGLIIDSAENGKIAVEKVKASAPGEYLFILMDIQMPVMDGWQATQEIRKLDNPELAQIPIIALSANFLESDKQQSVKTGLDAHLPKPIDIPVLLKTATKLIKK